MLFDEMYVDYSFIKKLAPTFWMSGTYFDGLVPGKAQGRTGLFTGVVDCIGNVITKNADINVTNHGGKSVFNFTNAERVISDSVYSSSLTFIFTFRRYVAGQIGVGRIFTSETGNRLFA